MSISVTCVCVWVGVCNSWPSGLTILFICAFLKPLFLFYTAVPRPLQQPTVGLSLFFSPLLQDHAD